MKKKDLGRQFSHRTKMIETWTLTKLKPHPRQAEDFGDLPEREFDALVERIKRCGLDEMIQILPNGTIISGHQRCRALLKLGHKEQKVVVRYDLASASDEEVEREFLESNTVRRQLSPLSQVKHAIRMLEITRNRTRGTLIASGDPQMRDLVAQRLDMSPRNASRYINILRCPSPIQKAFEAGFLTLVEASRCAFLSPRCQTALADKLSTVHRRPDAKQLLDTAQAKELKPDVSPTDEFKRLVKALARGHARIKPHVDRVNSATIHCYCNILRRSRALFRDLIARIPENE